MGSKPAKSKQKEFDIAIVGGGIAGLYAAWRLRQAWGCEVSRRELAEKLNRKAAGALEVVILEQDPLRLGGRLRSAELPFPGGHVIAEVGAMRFTTRHRLLRRLLDELKVRTLPFDGNGFTTRYYLRGKHFGALDIEHNDKENFPYHLQGGEQCQSPTALLSHVLECTLRELSLDDDATPETLRVLEKLRGKLSREGLTHREWEEIRKYGQLTGKVRLQNIGMWNLIHHYLSPDAAHFVEDGFGYESIIGNWNLSDAIPWFISDFSPAQSYLTLVGGFSHAVELLREKIAKPAEEEPFPFRCRIVMNTRVREISRDQQGLLLHADKMYFEYIHDYEGSMSDIFCEVEENGLKRKLRAKLVIFAVPKWPLEQLEIKDSVSSKADKKEWNVRLAEVRPHRLAKIVQGYRHAWWRKADSQKGAGSRVFTDLPLRQVYYFDREWLEERGRYQYYSDKGNLLGADSKPVKLHEGRKPEIEGMTVAYLDGHYASFWRFITAIITAVRMRGFLGGEPTNMDLKHRVKRIKEKEREKRDVFGPRIWAWTEPPMGELWELCRKRVEDWTDKERDQHLYFYRLGLYERASTKMLHILKDLHRSAKNYRSDGEIPDPVAGAYTFWENFGERFEAGWHTWEPGVNSTAAMKYMVKPFDAQVYVCGEAYSNEQGWIEGALKSVEMVMDRLGIMLPGEIPEPKDCEEREESEAIRDYVGLGPRAVSLPLSQHTKVSLSNDQSLIFISGKIGFTPPAEPVPSFEDQAREALNRLREEMGNAGAQEFVIIRVFLQSMAYYDKFNQIYADEFKKKEKPARTAIAVNALPFGALVELDAIARKKDGKLQK